MRPEPAPPIRWTKSSRCNATNACVETGRLSDLRVMVRDAGCTGSGSVLVFEAAEWRHFAAAIRAGRFDL